MINKLKLIIAFLLGIQFLKGQSPQAYDSIYKKIFFEVSQKNFSKSLAMADSLYKTSHTPLYKVKSLMLSATLCQQSGDVKEAIGYALKAEKHLEKLDDVNWKTRVYGFLATEFRFIDLYNLSNKYLTKTIDAAEQVKDSVVRNNLFGFIYQEKAFHELEKKNYRKSIDYTKKSLALFNKDISDNEVINFDNFYLMGLNYYYLKNYSLSKKYFSQSLEMIKEFKTTYRYALLNSKLANLSIEENNLVEAEKYLAEADKVARNSNYLNLKTEVLKSYEKYYLKQKDYKKLNEVKSKKDSIESVLRQKSIVYIDDAFKDLHDKVEAREKNEKFSFGKLIYSIGFVLAIGGLVLFGMKIKRYGKKDYTVVQESLVELKNQLEQVEQKVNTPQKVEEHDKIEEKNPTMTKETEEYILQKLNEFENSTLYLKKNLKLTFLASKIDTNTKYLSIVINQHKGKDFNNYINELKIQYILKKLDEDPQYLLFKISALSEEAGFSTQSKFASAFKKVTNFSPSVYITNLKESIGEKV